MVTTRITKGHEQKLSRIILPIVLEVTLNIPKNLKSPYITRNWHHIRVEDVRNANIEVASVEGHWRSQIGGGSIGSSFINAVTGAGGNASRGAQTGAGSASAEVSPINSPYQLP